MAHKAEDTGKYSELIARAALLASGWQAVSTSETEEAFDISAKDPLSGEWKTFQVKTIYDRKKRGSLIVQARKSDRTPYKLDEVDYFIGVLIGRGPVPTVWMFENRELTEYWGPQSKDGKRWVRMDLNFRREDVEITEINESEAV
ncbi:hypothetical protein [Bacillus velezensis]|uniref:hypothetical protein n=1 Tax=Bacillus velezensis TaxID=492670 RepID=UPI0005EB00C0|nr:hypothetical protein [Bacillus velezensis]KJR67819.1 hypothetical protein BAGR45_15185 [Bacillus velezensis]QAW23955.1 hypothetical protein ETA12_04750 [Bacillus velezensis]